MNLCTNSAHAMRAKGGVLCVKLSDIVVDNAFISQHPDLRAGPYVGITVSATGHGMDKDVIQKIFDPYFTTKGPGEGTGLALSVAQGIVKSCSGLIIVNSTPEKGTDFDVFLPNLLKVLEAFRSDPYGLDLLVTDMTMPGLRGDELAKELLAVRQDLPIILCTGLSELMNETLARKMGTGEFLMKPFTKQNLAKAVRNLLGRRGPKQEENISFVFPNSCLTAIPAISPLPTPVDP